jgi:RimJ/RimL family protein N-acetyltransferase
MPGSAPPPALRRPAAAWHGRYLANQVEREFAAMTERLDALEQDIRRARRAACGAPRSQGAPAPPPHGDPARLPDGTRLLVRPIEPEDAPQLRAGFKRLDAGSRYQRFLAPIPYLTQRDLDFLTRVDHEMHEALVAIDARTGEGVGIARFLRDPREPARADVAIVVDDRWHGRGVGTLLAGRLAERARAVGVTSFTARMLPGNDAARRLVERVGDDVRAREESGTIVLSARERALPRLEAPAPAPARRHLARRRARQAVPVLGRP